MSHLFVPDRSERNDKKHKKILILGIIVLTFAIHTLFYDSFTKYNGTPRETLIN